MHMTEIQAGVFFFRQIRNALEQMKFQGIIENFHESNGWLVRTYTIKLIDHNAYHRWALQFEEWERNLMPKGWMKDKRNPNKITIEGWIAKANIPKEMEFFWFDGRYRLVFNGGIHQNPLNNDAKVTITVLIED